MFKIFKKKTYYLKVYSDRVVIRLIEENKTIDRVSIAPFSNKRMVLADFEIFEHFTKELINLITEKKSYFYSKRVLIQVMEKIDGGLSYVELRAFKESSLYFGINTVKIYIKTDLLKDNKVLEIINSKNAYPFVKA